jgi:arylsulfatase A-like enzyme
MTIKNILFVMYDQLRADYLGCYGHPSIDTPAIDALARRGVRFTRAYCQSPVCGPSRMSFYSGRYVSSHGATWNNVPLRVSELTLGDYLKPHGLRVAVVGESHFLPDLDGMQRVGLNVSEGLGAVIGEGGFEPWDRDDQLHPDSSPDLEFRYNTFLRAQGYPGKNPWHDFANSGIAPDGTVASGWYMRNARLPARVKEEHSETAYFTDRAIEFIDDCGDQPWCLHLSFMKPHWPYIAPAPYHSIYGDNDVLPANRTEDELRDIHPVVAAFMNHDDSVAFRDEDQRRHVVPTYMGLIKQLDDHLARLLACLNDRGLTEQTLIVLTSDHGSYLGDHWLGEKELFHEESVRIPLIVFDPSPEANGTRGTADPRFAEGIDLIPTFLEALGQDIPLHRLEGRSLLPLVRGSDVSWRDAAFSEHDYGFMKARRELGLGPSEARSYMVRNDRWKYIYFEGFRPQLFDLANDPREQLDLGADPVHEATRAELHERLFRWLRTRAIRTTMSDEIVEQRTNTARERGIIIEIW